MEPGPGRRFVTLDGVRGVAALIVVAYHLGKLTNGWCPRFGYLAVDLFFALSGFVLAYANDRRFRTHYRASRFMFDRIVRLYPLYAIGLALGVATFAISPARGQLDGQGLATALEANLFLLPSPTWRLNRFIFPIDSPAWTLFEEFWIANLLFAIFWRQIQGRGLYLLIALAALGLMSTAQLFHTVEGGFYWRNAVQGVLRVMFSFFAGVAVSRRHAARPPRRPAPSFAVLLAAAVALCLPLDRDGIAPLAYEFVVVFAVFPALLYWGAGALERRPGIGRALGDASYALYVIHYPLIAIALAGLKWIRLPSSAAFELAFICMAALIAIALHHVYDRPVRGAIHRRLDPVLFETGRQAGGGG